MRIPILALLAACPGPQAQPTFKKPNNELIVGEFARRPPEGENAARFAADGTYRIAQKKALLDQNPPLAEGRYQLDGDKLIFTADKGQCADSDATKIGTYKVVISKVGIRYQKLEDSCEQRKLDGQTWWRQ
ncbi:MAG TPA: hypothetical protein VIU61_28965 [Kofleriaceae bacterium]